MSSFFTLPASRSKRKRGSRADAVDSKAPRRARKDDDSISGSDLSEAEADGDGQIDDFESEEDEEFEDEDPAAKRVRLAEQYLENTQREVLVEEGFDAADVDQENLRRRMGERLKQDTAESKGRLYRWIASDLDWQRGDVRTLRQHHVKKSYTGVALQGRYVYAVTKDMHLLKWELADRGAEVHSGRRTRTRPKLLKVTRGSKQGQKNDTHHGAILCIAASQDGKFVATGGDDRKIVIWDASTLSPLKVFPQHRDAVTSLVFRRGTNQLFSAARDRTVKTWSLDELAYVETLFGHQDEVLDVDALAQEQCVTVGARDRTARLWKVVEESQLVFRGGGAPSRSKSVQALKAAYAEDSGVELLDDEEHNEGSIDRVAMIDDDTFVTASDNGSLSLWDVRKKKPVFVMPFAHGLDAALPLDQASAEIEPPGDMHERSRGGKHPRWITALKSIPFSDTFVSGSWDGYVRAWKISGDKRRIESLGAVTKLSPPGTSTLSSDIEAQQDDRIAGIVNDLALLDVGVRGKDGLLIAAAIGKEHRLGRWKQAIDGVRSNAIVLFEVPRTNANGLTNGHAEEINETDGL